MTASVNYSATPRKINHVAVLTEITEYTKLYTKKPNILMSYIQFGPRKAGGPAVQDSLTRSHPHRVTPNPHIGSLRPSSPTPPPLLSLALLCSLKHRQQRRIPFSSTGGGGAPSSLKHWRQRCIPSLKHQWRCFHM